MFASVIAKARLAAAVLALAAAGCGSGGGKLHKVTGKVTFEGEPVKEGRIQFRNTGSDQRAYSAPITEGAYEVMCEPGTMKVEVIASRPIPGKTLKGENGETVPAAEMYIPTKYNTASTLTAEVKSGSNDIPFDLKK